MAQGAKRELTVDSIRRSLAVHAQRHPGEATKNERMDLFHGNGHPRCLVGHILADHGYKAKDFTVQTDDGPVRLSGIGGVASELLAELFPDNAATPEAIVLLDTLESDNDRAVPWATIASESGAKKSG